MVIRFDMRLLKKYKHKVQVQTTIVFCRSLWDCIVKQTFHAYIKALYNWIPLVEPKTSTKNETGAVQPCGSFDRDTRGFLYVFKTSC